ncbi:phage major capsid protein [Bacillus sp. FJAT-49705]|uniref:Phage major capsid protein n=1 Tax=Cytobacillus citreus TaxID=2833586 RepID=A0ABS5NV93_9BACI|nr:phage major capsid protein [Cytobacillus citreus]MBS4191750.1 phage major capsid protein [Cytobacillus citreus]
MNKELRELLEKISNKKAEAKQLLAENKIEEAKTARDEAQELQNKFDIAKDLYDQEKEEIENKKHENPAEKDEVKNFINAARQKFKNAMSEGSATDGGYTVPQDIQTEINELRQAKDAAQNLITVEPVTTLSGSRVFKARAQQTGFVEVPEDGSIPEKATPQFTQLAYKVKKYAGFFKMTNEVLKDSDQALRSVLVRWIGDESRVTRNKLIFAELAKKAKTAVTGFDDLKDICNVKLDPAFQETSVVVTNQDGFNWLDKQKDSDGNYLLQKDPTSATQKLLFGKYPVKVYSNKDLLTDTTKAPVIIGDLKEAIVMFDREQTDIMASDVAGDAYLTDNTLFRAIEREEVKTRDAEAFVYGQIDLTPTP